MQTSRVRRLRPRLVGILLVLCQVALTLAMAEALLLIIAYLFDVNVSITLSIQLRILGSIPLIAGLLVWASTFRVRKPGEMLFSTYITMTRSFRSQRVKEDERRSEPFVPVGPYRYVRNPLYFGIILFAVGLGIGTSSILLIIWVLVIICWFWFLLIPYEERELIELFGELYIRYKTHVPRLFPDGRKYVEDKPGNKIE